jgi:hypothetical protein
MFLDHPRGVSEADALGQRSNLIRFSADVR